MLSVKEIEQAIANLPRQELALFREWFEGFDARMWDGQFEADAQAGKFNKLAEEAKKDYLAGNAKEL